MFLFEQQQSKCLFELNSGLYGFPPQSTILGYSLIQMLHQRTKGLQAQTNKQTKRESHKTNNCTPTCLTKIAKKLWIFVMLYWIYWNVQWKTQWKVNRSSRKTAKTGRENINNIYSSSSITNVSLLHKKQKVASLANKALTTKLTNKGEKANAEDA